MSNDIQKIDSQNGNNAFNNYGNQIQTEQYIEKQTNYYQINNTSDNEVFYIYLREETKKEELFEQVKKYLLFKNDLDFMIINEQKQFFEELLSNQYDFIEGTEVFELEYQKKSKFKNIIDLKKELTKLNSDLKIFNYEIAPLFNKYKYQIIKEEKLLIEKIKISKEQFLKDGKLPSMEDFFRL